MKCNYCLYETGNKVYVNADSWWYRLFNDCVFDKECPFVTNHSFYIAINREGAIEKATKFYTKALLQETIACPLTLVPIYEVPFIKWDYYE